MKVRHIILRISALMAIALFGLLWFAIPVFATDPPDSTPTVSNIKANVNLLETGDVLIYGLYNIPYTTLPDDDAGKTYVLILIDTDNVTQLGVIRPYAYMEMDNGYNIGAFSFRFSASDNLTVDQPYTVRISQNPTYFETPEFWDYSMPTSGWTDETSQEDNQTELMINVLELAQELEIAHDITLLEDSAGGTVLSSPYGETYFRGAIYGIQAMAPDLFLVQAITWDTSDRDWTTEQFDEYDARFSGTFIGTATDNTSGTYDVDTGTMMSLLFGIPIIGGALIVSQIKWRKLEPGYIVGAVVIILLALMGWIQSALFATIYQLLALYIGYLWFYARAGDTLGGKMLSFLIFAWVSSTVICLIVEGSWIGSAENTVINDLAAFTTLKIGGLATLPVPNLHFFRGIFRILLWDYSFYTGDFALFRYLWLGVFGGTAVYCFIRDFAPVIANFLRIR